MDVSELVRNLGSSCHFGFAPDKEHKGHIPALQSCGCGNVSMSELTLHKKCRNKKEFKFQARCEGMTALTLSQLRPTSTSDNDTCNTTTN